MTFKCISMMSAVVLATALMSSCSDKKDEPASVKDVIGSYDGLLVATALPVEGSEVDPEQTYAAAALVKADSMLVDISPLAEEVLKSIGKEGETEEMDITCKIAYAPTMSKNNDSISLQLTPAPIVLITPATETEKSDTIMIEITPSGLGSYAIASKELAFDMVSGKVTKNGEPVEVKEAFEMSFSFDKK